MIIFFNFDEHGGIHSDFDESCQNIHGKIAGEKLDPLCSEDAAYEYFCDIADRFIGVPIAAIARFDQSSEEGYALFRTRIRAIYRASVWGQFSLLCEGISTPDELEKCADILKEVFCELESEGREFNGFIEKGVCTDTPMTLYNLNEHLRFDFICFDLQKLRRLCTGTSGLRRGESELISHVSRICQRLDKCEIAIKASGAEEAKRAVKLLESIRINKIFLK